MPSLPNDPTAEIVIAVTGASGTAYCLRLLQTLLAAGAEIHVVVSDAARQVARREAGVDYPAAGAGTAGWRQFLNAAFCHESIDGWFGADIDVAESGRLRCYGTGNFSAGIASGSYQTTGMVICPCSMGTLSAIASGASSNLIHRAADVHLKERRPLVLVPRETPIGLIGLRNMTTLAEAGATVLPAMPGFYQRPSRMGDLVDFVVARICDQLKIAHTLGRRWGHPDENGPIDDRPVA